MSQVLVDLATPDEALAEIQAERERRRRGHELLDEARELAGDFRSFIRGAWPIVEPTTPFASGWHIDAIADHLEACTHGEIRRLIINIPPRHMKSLNVSVFWPGWQWTRKPSTRFLTASYGGDLATRDAVKTRRLIQSAWYRARWSSVFALTTDQNVKTRYENDRTGYRIATSVGGGATGEGGDIILIDDPHKADEVESDTQRQAVLDWHDGTISTRFNDLETGVEVVVMQRLHERDLTGHLLDQGGFVQLCLPAEYEPSHPFVWPDDPRGDSDSDPANAYRADHDVDQRPGGLLWPEHVSATALDEVKTRLGSYKAAGQLQQRPAPAEGGILKTGWWRYYDPANLEEWRLPPLVSLCASWDTALKAKTTNDYTVGSLWGARGADRFLLRRFRDRVGLPDTKMAVREMAMWAEEHFPGLPLINVVENAANGPEVVSELRDKVQGLVLNNAKGDKVVRAHAVSPQIEAGNVFVPGFAMPDGSGPDAARTPAWVQELVAECAAFPNAGADDQVDSMTQALTRLRGAIERAPRREPDEDARPQRQITAGLMDQDF